jgi:hypothetical protein
MLRWLLGALMEIVEAIVDAITGGGARAKTMEGLEARRRAEEQSAARERDQQQKSK